MGNTQICGNLWLVLQIAVVYTKVLKYACYAVSGSVGETAPLTTAWEAVLGAPCKLDSWVTHEFVGNKFNFGSNKQTKHFNYPTI